MPNSGGDGAAGARGALPGRRLYAALSRLYDAEKGRPGAAYDAVRKGVFDYDRRAGYRGPEASRAADPTSEKTITTTARDHPDSDDLLAAVVLAVDGAKQVDAALRTGRS